MTDPRRGMILFTVLWAMAFCSVLAMATSTTFRGLSGIVTIERDRVEADALLSAGLEAAAGIVGTIRGAPLIERGATIALSTGSVAVRVSDEGGRIDIGKAPVELLASLLRYAGADEEAAEMVSGRIIELRGAADQKPRPNEVAKQQGPAPKPAAPASAVAFTDVRQLAGVSGMRPEWLAAMAPLITVFGSDTVNPLTAPIAVLRALPSFDEARLDTFLDMRGAPLVDPERLAFILGPAQKYLKVREWQVVAVDLRARTTDGYTAAASAFIVLLADDKQPYRVLAWNPASAQTGADVGLPMGGH